VAAKSLSEHRRERLLTIRSLADASGCAPRTVLHVEHGRRKPQPGTMKRLAAALGVDPKSVREFRLAMGLPPDEEGCA
jgi:transcriptional regulator with XRE-family HTH domain